MSLLFILTGFVGVFLGTAGMALLVSGRRADKFRKETILKQTLAEVWNWYSSNPSTNFPEKDVRQALNLE